MSNKNQQIEDQYLGQIFVTINSNLQNFHNTKSMTIKYFS